MILFTNAHIYNREEDSFVVDDNIFVDFGSKEELSKKYSVDSVVDLNNRYLYPGFIDSHMHVLNYGFFLSTYSLYEHTSSIKELQEYLKDAAKELKKGSWIRGRGWNQDYFEEKRMLTRQDLDDISLDHPIYLTRACGHMAVLNTCAIRTLGFTENRKYEMGQYDIDTGLFEEFAVNEVQNRLPKPSKKELKDYIIKAAKALNAYGVTSCHSDDLETFSGLDYHLVIEAFKELEKEGKLNVRINQQCQLIDADSLKTFIAEEHYKKNSDYFRFGPLKLIADGSLGARTAYLKEAYENDGDNRGLSLYSQEQLNEMILLAHQNKMSCAVHCIGDGALQLTVNAYRNAIEKCPEFSHRSGIVHIQITDKKLIEEMIELKLVSYIQSIFIDYDSKIVEDCVGKDRAGTSYQFKTLFDRSVNVSNGSDAPVELPDVLKGMECAITRCSIGNDVPYLPEQALTVDEVIKTYTINGAYNSFEEDEKGLLKEGYLADFVILENDLHKVDPHDIHKVKVLETYLGGAKVY